MLRFVSAMIVVCIGFACSKGLRPNSPASFNGLAQLDFCELPKYEGQLVYVKAIYTGVEEYWALKSLRRCDSNLNVELDDRAGRSIPHRFKAAFDSVYTSYWDTYLIVEATGVYESKSSGGYGHLGSNTARLIMRDYVNVIVVKKTAEPD